MRNKNRSPPKAEADKRQQCKHTFRITADCCAPCSGYDVECKHYEGNDAADTKHCPR
jgi:hypothetical protein|nr:MAG TPA: epoxyqueuosine reductase [Caudoviricetes sp.]